MEQDLRKQAIQRYLKGESPKTIYTDLNRSKNWFFKWLKRYRSGNTHWYEDHSRAPKRQPTALSEVQRRRIISTRRHLDSQQFAQIGPSAIKWELGKAGYSLPSDSTIKRVLKQEGLVKKTSYVPKGVEYPYFKEPYDIHQADLVGPRYIKRNGKFYSFNIMDLASHYVYIESQRSKQDRQVASSLLRCWKTVGLPDFLQLDNELSFRGSNRYPHSFGLVIRLCLYFDVTPVFIPVSEPWRNGTIEKFNDTYNKKFFRRQWFPSYAFLKRQSKNFQRFHNKHHRYSYLKGKTPLQAIRESNFKPMTIGANTKIPQLDAIPDGNIMLIRFIRSDRLLDIFGEKFKVSKDLVYSYVKAVIVTKIHRLQVYVGELFESFDYEIPAE